MKRIVSFLLAMTLLCSFTPAFAAGASSFYDVPKEAWFYEHIDFVTQNNMFNGTSANTFSPDLTMNRGMFITVLGRYAKAPATYNGGISAYISRTDVNVRTGPSTKNTEVIDCLQKNTTVEYVGTYKDSDPSSSYKWTRISYKGRSGYVRNDLITVKDSVFYDVPINEYFRPYVRWAHDRGLIKGLGNGTFNPYAPITREEICYILNNFCINKNLDLKLVNQPVDFIDSWKINPTYKNAVSRLQQANVINGYEDKSFKPKGSARRSEVSKMLHCFIDATSYVPGNGNGFGEELSPSSPVSASYFDDACFIGHSLVHGMSAFFGLNNADYLYFDGASSTSLMETQDFELSTTHENEEGETVHDKGSLKDALSERNYSKIYIMLGANECRSSVSGRNAFYSNMKKLVNIVREKQPNATFYIFSMTPVTEDLASENELYKNDNILAYNNTMRRLCKDLKLNYLNIYDLLVAEDGYLPNDRALPDGLHILGPEYTKIKNYMFTHTA